jgi:hypothetical protein
LDPIRPPVAEGSLDLVPGPSRAAVGWSQNAGNRIALRQATADAFEGAARVVRSTRLPTRKGAVGFFTYQLLINSVAWTAGLIAAGLVTSFFEVRGLRNLWGLTASGSRTVVSADDYQLIMTLTSFCAGLLMMIFVRHFILRWIAEIRSLHQERERGQSASSDVRSAPVGAPAPDFEGLEADHDH